MPQPWPGLDPCHEPEPELERVQPRVGSSAGRGAERKAAWRSDIVVDRFDTVVDHFDMAVDHSDTGVDRSGMAVAPLEEELGQQGLELGLLPQVYPSR